MIKENLLRVQADISKAAARAGRRAEDIQLLAVSKTKSVEAVREAFKAGQKRFGENYVQEALEKITALPEPQWHLIGPLQTNKVKQIAGKTELIHTLDREKLANEINKASMHIGVVQDVLIQVHIGDEVTKSGVDSKEAPKLIEQVLKLPHLRLKGLMALPPLEKDESESRKNFALLREYLEDWKKFLPENSRANFSTLSMGTSSDFLWAILEGATLVRVGTLIFGERKSLMDV